MRHIKLFEEEKIAKFKTGDYVFIIKEKDKKFKVEDVVYNRVYILDSQGWRRWKI